MEKAPKSYPSEDIVCGVHAVTEALLQHMGNKLYIQKDVSGKQVERLKELAGQEKVAVSFLSKRQLTEMSDGARHQGFVLRTSRFAYSTLESLLAQTANRTNPLILMLDEIQDPHNLGSILRTADATGVAGIIVPKHRATGVTPVVAKVAAGALAHVPLVRVTNLSQTVDRLKEKGYWIFGTDMAGTPSTKWQTSGKLVLIIGNEGRGISPNLKKKVDEMVTIPMCGHAQSLNASVAAAILMYEVFRSKLD